MTDGPGMAGESPFVALRRLARSAARQAEDQCDLCAAPIGREHRHLLNVSTREIHCVCTACRILFGHSGAAGGERRLVPTRYVPLPGGMLSEAQWEALHLPVSLVFFCRSTPAGRVLAMYPGPMGLTESLLPLETWSDLERQHPVLRGMEPDVEALLVNRRGDGECFLVPIDECFKLAGLIRVHWRGLTGGREVWQEVQGFFAQLRARAGGGDHA